MQLLNQYRIGVHGIALHDKNSVVVLVEMKQSQRSTNIPLYACKICIFCLG